MPGGKLPSDMAPLKGGSLMDVEEDEVSGCAVTVVVNQEVMVCLKGRFM